MHTCCLQKSETPEPEAMEDLTIQLKLCSKTSKEQAAKSQILEEKAIVRQAEADMSISSATVMTER